MQYQPQNLDLGTIDDALPPPVRGFNIPCLNTNRIDAEMMPIFPTNFININSINAPIHPLHSIQDNIFDPEIPGSIAPQFPILN